VKIPATGIARREKRKGYRHALPDTKKSLYLFMRDFVRICCILLILPFSTAGQTDTCKLRISLLTCSPGSELYSTFGHSALRVVDSSTGTDIVYNYGVFDFHDPDFYVKFVRGKLLYYLDQGDFNDFLYAYSMDDRSVSEQLLRFDCQEKIEIQRFLFDNLRPENRSYKYDFLFDNCTTRLRDLIWKQLRDDAATAAVTDDPGRTFRNHLHHYLDMNRMDWAKLGIDILLGSRLDRAMDNSEAMFLPDYLEKGIDSTLSGGNTLSEEKQLLYSRSAPSPGPGNLLSPPLIACSVFCAAIMLLPYSRSRIAENLMAMGDFMLFFLTGLLGVLLFFMWTATDHALCRDNLNLLWALPTHLPAAFFIRSSKMPAKRYFTAVALLSVALLATWPFLPQELNPALIPLIIATGWRSWQISKGVSIKQIG
jgi:hypothetical protein